MIARVVLITLVFASLLSGCVVTRIIDKGEVEHHPMSDQDRREATASQKVSEALSLFHDGNFLDPQGAVRTLSEAVELDPDNYDAHLYRGLALARLGEYSRAEQDLMRAASLKPSDARSRYLLGYTLWQAGRSLEGIHALDEAIRRNPSLTQAYTQRGAIRAELGEHEKAIEDFRQAMSLSPGDFDPRFRLGQSCLMLEQYQQAYRAFSGAASLKPDSAAAFEGRARALMGLGRYDDAARDLHFALSSNPDNADLRALYASTLERSGNLGGAIRAYRRAAAGFRNQDRMDDAKRMDEAARRLMDQRKTS